MASPFGSFAGSRRQSSPFHLYKAVSVDGILPGVSHSNGTLPSTARLPPALPSSGSTFKFNFHSPSAPISASTAMVAESHSKPSRTAESREAVSVTVRFRPLSWREMQRGDEVAWYADGDCVVRSEYNPANAYAFDRVFGPATTTKNVYDVAAKNIVRGAMEGINGTVFAYGVTSSGKTHTMHGDPKSPGIIPLAVKDVFKMIQENPSKEYLLRLSYLEIYNEVINDLLNPACQNLRIREDSQGTYVEGLKEEVVLSPAHALSLIAAGEEHRHVGSNNFNLLSSRSHTVFTLTVVTKSKESMFYDEGEEVTVSQLNLIDLAGSESSKTETTGLRMKEGSYINKSLLTLGTVIGKLSEGRSSHVPYRDSKLTRLLQSSLGGNARVSLICTLTPASSNMEETHNTLKFAQRAKRIIVQATPNQIIDEKLLIRRYQREIMNLKEELNQLKQGAQQHDLVSLREQLEAGKEILQSRLEEEEEAKSALLCRIQRLTKLILVSTKSNFRLEEVEQSRHKRRHSFGDEKFVSMEERKRMFALGFNDDSRFLRHAGGTAQRRTEGKRDPISWGKLQKSEYGHTQFMSNDSLSCISSQTQVVSSNSPDGGEKSCVSQKTEASSLFLSPSSEITQAGELFTAAGHGQRLPLSGHTIADQMELLREQLKMLAGEFAVCMSSMKRLTEQGIRNPDDVNIQVQRKKMKAEIAEKEEQMRVLEMRIIMVGKASLEAASPAELSEAVLKLIGQLNEKEVELEKKSADTRILREELDSKSLEIKKLQQVVATMQRQCNETLCDDANSQKSQNTSSWRYAKHNSGHDASQINGASLNMSCVTGESREKRSERDYSDSESYSSRGSSGNVDLIPNMQNQILKQATEIENLKQEKVILREENGGLQVQCQKLAEEASYAKELASAAAVELRNLAEEVTRLSFQNSKLSRDLSLAREEAALKRSSSNIVSNYHIETNGFHNDDTYDDIDAWNLDPEDVKRELHARKEREKCLEAALVDMEEVETDLRKKLEESKRREIDLENELAGMWVQLARLKKEKGSHDSRLVSDAHHKLSAALSNITIQEDCYNSWPVTTQDLHAIEEMQAKLEEERERNSKLSTLVSRLKSERLEGLQPSALEELQQLHMEALTKLFQAKARTENKADKGKDQLYDKGWDVDDVDQQCDDKNNHVCKVCFEAPTAAVLLPCRHFCLCKHCAVACTECPLCRSGIADRIITFMS